MNIIKVLALIGIMLFAIGITLTVSSQPNERLEDKKKIEKDALAWQIDMCNKMDCWIDNPTVDRT